MGVASQLIQIVSGGQHRMTGMGLRNQRSKVVSKKKKNVGNCAGGGWGIDPQQGLKANRAEGY